MEYLDFAKEIALKAGEIMRKYFNIDNGQTYKNDKTIVTLADREINSYLIKRVKETYPAHSVDGEEEGYGEGKYVWVCDPVDGTAMYARGIPVAVFSLALVVDGAPMVGVVYDPFTDTMYQAVKGEGAFKNGQPMHVNNLELDDMRSVSDFCMWPQAGYNIFDAVKKLSEKTYFVELGSTIRACMCVASGDFTLELFPGVGHKNCDMAAAKIIVEEAGGKVTDMFGNEQRYDRGINGTIVSNGVVHDEVLQSLKKYMEKVN